MMGRDRSAARTALGREFPTCILSVVQRVPISTIAHVSARPPCDPGQSDFPSPVGDHGSPRGAFPMGWRLKCPPTYPPHHTVCPSARRRASVVPQSQALHPVMVSVSDRHDREPLRRSEALPLQEDHSWSLGWHYPTVFATTGSCASPPPSHVLWLSLGPRVFAGWCESLLGNGPSRHHLCGSFVRCLDPYPGGFPWCLCPFLPRKTSACSPLG
jgi:hypothetical protein